MTKLRRYISILLILAMVLPFATQLMAEDLIDNPEIFSEVIEEHSDIQEGNILNEEELSIEEKKEFQDELSENDTNKIEGVTSHNVQIYPDNDDNTELAEKRIAVALLLDVSYSMEYNQEKPFYAMKNAAKEFCKTILEKNPNVRIALIRQYSNSFPVSFESGGYWSSDIHELEKTIDNIYYGSGTGIESAFKEANRLLSQIDADQKVIINMSDGAPNYGKTKDDGELFSKEEIEKESGEDKTYMRTANGTYDYIKKLMNAQQEYQIFSIGFFHADPDKKNISTQIGTKLMENAHNSGYYDATNEEELLEAYKKIADVVMSPISIEVKHKYMGGTLEHFRYILDVEVKNKYKLGIINSASITLNLKENGYVKGDKQRFINNFSDTVHEEFEVVIDKNKYSNGGRFEYEIIFSNNQVGSFKVKSFIPIVKNKDNFVFGKDSYSFENFSNNILLSYSDVESMYKATENKKLDLDVVDRKNIQLRIRQMRIDNHRMCPVDGKSSQQEPCNNSVGGHCYGMSVTSILNHGNIIGDETFYYGRDGVLYDIEKNDKIINIIQYYHIQQFLTAARENFDQTKEKFKKDARDVFNDLETNIESSKRNGTLLPLVCFRWFTEYKKGEGYWPAGHAVIATDIEHDDFEYNGKMYDSKVQFYDSNYPGLTVDSVNERKREIYYGKSYLLFNSKTGDWIIPAYKYTKPRFLLGGKSESIGSDYKNKSGENLAIIICVTNDLNEMSGVDYKTSIESYKSYIGFCNKFQEKLQLRDLSKKKKWKLVNSEIINYKDLYLMPEIGYNPDNEEVNRFDLVLSNNDSIFELSTEDNREIEFNNSIIFGEKFLSGETKEAKKLIFDPSGSVDLVGNKGEFLITIADNETKDGTFNVYTIEGSGEGDLKAVKTDEGLKLYGNYTSGTITFEDENGVVGKKDIETNKDVVEYKKQANKLYVSDEEREYNITVTKSDKVSSYNITEANGTNGKYKDGTEVVIKDVVCQDSFKPLVKIKVKDVERILEDENGEYKFILTDNTEVIISTDIGENIPNPEVPTPQQPIPEEPYVPGYEEHHYEPSNHSFANSKGYKLSVNKEEKKEEAASEFTTLFFYIDKPYYETIIDGQAHQIPMDVQPTIINERTMLPIRFVAEAIGAVVEWHQDTKSATFTKGVITATITLGNSVITVSDGRTIQMDANPTIINDRIMVPLTNISQIFGLTNGDLRDGINNDIEWDKDNYRVIIKIKK